MASGTPTPVPPRPRRRSFAGPLILILIGVLFLVRNLGYPLPLFRWFALYWPLLIILWGVLKAVEYWQARREGAPAPSIGPGGVLLLLFLVIFGVSANRALNVNWSGVRDNLDLGDGDFIGLFGNAYDFTDTVEQDMPAGALSVNVICERGDVVVHTGPDNKIKIIAHKKIYADSQNAANQITGDSKPTITLDGAVVTLHSTDRERVISNLEIYLPKKMPLTIEARHGDVNVTERVGDVKIATEHGDASVAEITGNANITLRHGSVSASQVSGDLAVNGRVDDSTISQIGGSVSFAGDFFGDMHVTKVAKSVRFNSSRTDLEFQKLDGDFTMSSGDLRASDFAGPFRLTTNAKDIHLQDFTGDVRIQNRNGEVSLQPGKLPLGNLEVSNQRQTITVELPAKAGFQLDAQTERGEISSDFDTNIETGGDRKSSHRTATVGGGGAHIKLTNDRGDIEIHKGS